MPRTPASPSTAPTKPELPWDSIEDWWSEGRATREIPLRVEGYEALVGREGSVFARLTPGPREGELMMHERDYRGNEQGRPRYLVTTTEVLECQLRLAAAAAKWRLRRKDAGWIKPRRAR